MSDPIEEPDVTDETSGLDPDADPENLNPRDERDAEQYEGDPDADPGNLNPRG